MGRVCGDDRFFLLVYGFVNHAITELDRFLQG